MPSTPHRSQPRFTILLGVALSLSLLLPPVAQARNMDSRKMKDLVARLVNERTGLATKAVECPRRIPMQEGQKSTCTATLSDDTQIAIDFVQTDDAGSVTFLLRDTEALAILGPPAQQFIRQWLDGQFGAIHRDAHQMLTSDVSTKGLQGLLECNGADYGGLDRAGEAEAAVLHRQQGSGEVHVPLEFGGGLEVTLKLTYMRDGDEWKLAGLNLPPAPQDSTQFEQQALLRTIDKLFAETNAGRWQEVYDGLSHELQQGLTVEELRKELDNPWNLGAAGRSRAMSVARNAHGLPVVNVMTQRERGPSRSIFSFRSCGEIWKVRTASLIPPDASPLTASPEQIEGFLQTEARNLSVNLTASCPGEEYMLIEGLTYTCTARHTSGKTAPVELTVTASDGSVRWALLTDNNDDWR